MCVDSRYRLREFARVHGATPNLQELEACAGRRLDGDDDVADAAETLRRQLEARFLLATRGNRDTVLAVLTAALAAGGTPADAARLANIAGGLVVMKLGTATVTAAELRDAVADAVEEP